MGIERGLSALNPKLTKFNIHIGCPSYPLTSWRKSALIVKPSALIPKAFHQHVMAEKTKMIRYNCFHIPNWIAYLYWKKLNFILGLRRKLRGKFQNDVMFQRIGSFHPNINLTIEINLNKFLHNKLTPNGERVTELQFTFEIIAKTTSY